MPVFAINFFSIFFWAFLTSRLPYDKRKNNLIFLVIIFMQFTFLAWQRDFYVGQDTYGYFRGFTRMSKVGITELSKVGWEPGYKIWNWIIFNLGGDFHTYLLFSGAFIYFSFLRFVYKFSDRPWLSVIIFVTLGYYLGSYHLLRQYLAIAVILFSYQYVVQRKIWPFIALVLLATSFHISAISFIVTYFVCGIKDISKRYLVLIFLFTATIAFFVGDIVLPKLIIFEKFAKRYLDDGSSGRGYGMLLFLIVTFLLGLMRMPEKLSVKEKCFYMTALITLCIQPFATYISMISREILYWSMSLSIFIPMAIKNFEDEKDRRLITAFICIGLIAFFVFFTNSNEGIERWATYRWFEESKIY